MNLLRIKTLIASAAALSFLAVAQPALAQEFPAKEMMMIVNYGAGGGTDLSARVLAAEVEDILGKPIRVENRTGGNGTVGVTAIATAKPDGYTFGVTSFSPMAITPHLQPVPYSIEGFDYIVGYGRYRYSFAVSANSPYNSVADILRAAGEGREFTYANTSAVGDILAKQLEEKYHIPLKRVSYKSGSEAITAVMSGVADITFENPAVVLPQIKAGNLKLLASASSTRWFELPDIPTLKEEGFDVYLDSYAGLAAPTGIPPERLAILREAFSNAIANTKVQQTLKDLGMEPVDLSGEEYEDLLTKGYGAMATYLEKIGVIQN